MLYQSVNQFIWSCLLESNDKIYTILHDLHDFTYIFTYLIFHWNQLITWIWWIAKYIGIRRKLSIADFCTRKVSRYSDIGLLVRLQSLFLQTNDILVKQDFVSIFLSFIESNFKVPIFRYFDLRFSRFRKENSTIFQSLTKIDFDFLCSSFRQSNERSFWCLFAIFYLQHWSASCSKMQKK